MGKQITSKVCMLLNAGVGTPTESDVVTTNNKPIVYAKTTSVSYQNAGAGPGSKRTKNNPDLTTAEWDVNVLARGGSAAGAAPAYGDLFKICGMSEAIEADTSVTYAPVLPGTTGTAKVYVNGEVRTITGITGNFKLKGAIGEFAEFTFSLKGFTDIVPADEDNPTVTLDNSEPYLLLQATAITENGASIDLTSIELDAGMKTQQSYGADSKEYYIEDFEPVLNIEAIKTKGNKEHWIDLQNNSVKEIVVELGTTEGKRIEVRATYCNPDDVSESDKNGEMHYKKTFVCENSAGGDNFTIKYY